MSAELEALLDELARRHARGEPLDVEGTLHRADELAPLIEAFLARAPRREPSPSTLAYVRSLDEPPLLRARVAKALKVDDVVDAIVAECELSPEARPKVRRYYQQLEGGILDPTRPASRRPRGTRSPASSAARASCSAPRSSALPRKPRRCTGPTASWTQTRWRASSRVLPSRRGLTKSTGSSSAIAARGLM